MRRIPLLIVLLSTACVGSYPVRIRPGSNVALPNGGSVMDGIVRNLVCEKNRKNRKNSPDSANQCGLLRPDTLSPGSEPPVPVPPGKRP